MRRKFSFVVGVVFALALAGGYSTFFAPVALAQSPGLKTPSMVLSPFYSQGSLAVGDGVAATIWNTEAVIFESEELGFWNHTGELEPSDQDAVPELVALTDEGDVALVAAPSLTVAGGSNGGALYLFERQPGGGWLESQRLIEPTPAAEARFGAKAAFDGSTLVVWSGTEDGEEEIHVFEPDTAGVFSPIANWRFEGSEVLALALDGDVLGITSTSGGVGTLDIYERVAGSWTATGQFSDGARDFGASLAAGHLAGGDAVIAVGAWRANAGRGQVSMYRLAAGTWTLDEILVAGVDQQWFGELLAFDSGRLLVAESRNSDETRRGGAIFLYEEDGAGWQLGDRLRPSTLPNWGEFPYGLAAGGGWLLAAHRDRGHLFDLRAAAVAAFVDDRLCVPESPWTFTAAAAGTLPIDSLAYRLEGEPPGDTLLCTGCGADPVRTFDLEIDACREQLLTVAATDSAGDSALDSTVVYYDEGGPVMDSEFPFHREGCRDITVVLPYPMTETSGGLHSPMAVPLPVISKDDCEGVFNVYCDRYGPFPLGSTPVVCTTDFGYGRTDDLCGHSGVCELEVHAVRPPHPGCYTHTFWEEDEFGEQPEDRGWTMTAVGDAEYRTWIGEHGLEIRASTREPRGLGDHVAFMHRQLGFDTDFRLEAAAGPDHDARPLDQGGIMVRWGLFSWAPQASIFLEPAAAGGRALHFTVRRAQYEEPVALADSITLDHGQRFRAALELRGQTITAFYSTDGGETWQIPGGGLGGSAEVSFFEPAELGLAVATGGRDRTVTLGSSEVITCTLLGAPPPPPVGCAQDAFDGGQLDAAWTVAGLGNANQVAARLDGGALELEADGATAFAGADNAGFVFQAVEGDFRAEVTVDGEGMDTGGPFRKAGLMVRAALDRWAPRLLHQLVPYWDDGSETHLQMVARQSQDGWGNIALAPDVTGVPRQLRLAVERRGDELAVEYSLDGGSTFIRPPSGSLQMPNLPATLLLGPDVVSNDISTTATARFDDFTLCSLPACFADDFSTGGASDLWSLDGIGHANQVTSAVVDGALELTADGATAFAGDDNAGFLHRRVRGDFRIEVDVDGAGMSGGGPYRKAGLMARAGTEPDAARVIAQLVPYWNGGSDTHLQVVARQVDGGPGNVAVVTDVVGVPRQLRLALERSHETLSFEYSLDGGSTWIRPASGLGGSVDLPGLPSEMLVGLDVVSNDISATSTARFDDVEICVD